MQLITIFSIKGALTVKSIYLDYAATTPVHPDVTDKYIELLQTQFGNPSSIHSHGREARKWLDDARKNIAQSIQAKPSEIIFTSGGTESDNLAIRGTVSANKELGNHIITTEIEHPAVLNTCKQLELEGFDVTYLKVDENGYVNAQQVKDSLTPETILVSIMLGNNEVGTIQPIAEIGHMLKSHQAVFHTDAVQAYGVIPIHVDELNVDLLSVSSHKINGPKGVGFLYERTGTTIASHTFGGEQERKRRAGTENVPAISAFSLAVTIARNSMEENHNLYKKFTSIILTTLDQHDVNYVVNAKEVKTLPHILNIRFIGTDIESLLVNLDMAGISASSGSACSAGTLEPSHVLTAMFGKESPNLRNAVRFSFGLGLDENQVQHAATQIAEIVTRLVK